MEVFLRVFEEFLISKSGQDAQGTDIVVVDVDVDTKLDVNVYEIDRKLGKGILTQSSATGLITTRDKKLDLVYVNTRCRKKKCPRFCKCLRF